MSRFPVVVVSWIWLADKIASQRRYQTERYHPVKGETIFYAEPLVPARRMMP